MIWPPCGTVLTGGLHDDLTTMWHCVHWWNAQWSDHHVALCSLVEWTMIWPPCGTVFTGEMHNDLSQLQPLYDLNLSHLIAASVSRHQWTCAMTSFRVCVQNPPLWLHCYISAFAETWQPVSGLFVPNINSDTLIHSSAQVICLSAQVICSSDSLKCSDYSLKCSHFSLRCSGDSLKCSGDSLKCSGDPLECSGDSLKCSGALTCLGDSLNCSGDSLKCSGDSLKYWLAAQYPQLKWTAPKLCQVNRSWCQQSMLT